MFRWLSIIAAMISSGLVRKAPTKQCLSGLDLKKKRLEQKRELILASSSFHGPFDVRIFGSIAQTVATQDRDIDFLVDYLKTQLWP